MPKILDFIKEKENRVSHLSGEILCIECRHKWVGIAPEGTLWLECPACGTMKGRFMHHIRISDTPHWECKCGNDLFFLTPDGSYCPKCGIFIVKELI